MNRRFYNQRQNYTRTQMRKLIFFQLSGEQYAIAIAQVQYILKEFTPHATLKNGHSLVQNRGAITLIDLSAIFLNSAESHDYHYLIVSLLKNGERLGIPIVEMPKIIEVPADKFIDLPQLYRGNELPLAIEKLINLAEDKTGFYLNLERLLS